MDKKLLLKEMIYIRQVEEAIAKRYSEQEMRCPVHLSIGQEAVSVGVCAHLSENDYIMSTHRAHAHYLAKGGDLSKMMAEIYGKVTGCSLGRGGSMHLVDLSKGFLGSTPIVGGSMPVALGAAFANAFKKNGSITVVFFGEGMTEEGVFMECLNFASLKQLPIIFVCENNLYSVYSPLSVRQPSTRSRIKIAEAHGITASLHDGNDVIRVFQATQNALNHIRASLGPVYLEFETYRWREHCGPNYDNHIGYRAEKEFEKWKLTCPIQKLISQLTENGELGEDELIEMKTKISEIIQQAFDFAIKSPYPTPEQLNHHIYS